MPLLSLTSLINLPLHLGAITSSLHLFCHHQTHHLHCTEQVQLFPNSQLGGGLWGTESFLDFSSHGVGEGAAMAPQAAVLLHPGTLSSSASHSQVLAHSALVHLFWLLTAETLPPSAFSSPHWLSLFSDGINRACPWASPFSIAGRCLGTVFPQHQKECVLTHSCRARAWKWRNETSLSSSEQDLSNTTSFRHSLSQFFPR